MPVTQWGQIHAIFCFYLGSKPKLWTFINIKPIYPETSQVKLVISNTYDVLKLLSVFMCELNSKDIHCEAPYLTVRTASINPTKNTNIITILVNNEFGYIYHEVYKTSHNSALDNVV